MYIAYVYIEEFEGLASKEEPLELCLSNQYLIRKESLEDGKMTLSIKKNPEFIEGFWDVGRPYPKNFQMRFKDLFPPSEIDNVSILVGKNGSGKTRILKLLWMIAANQVILEDYKFLALLHDKDQSKWISVCSDMELSFLVPNSISFENRFARGRAERNTENSANELSYVDPIYYSPAFQGKDSILGIDRTRGADVSVSNDFFTWLNKNRENASRSTLADKELKDVVSYFKRFEELKKATWSSPRFLDAIFTPFSESARLKANSGTSRSGEDVLQELFSFFKSEYLKTILGDNSERNLELAIQLHRCGILVYELSDIAILHKQGSLGLGNKFWNEIRQIMGEEIEFQKKQLLIWEYLRTKDPRLRSHKSKEWYDYVEEIEEILRKSQYVYPVSHDPSSKTRVYVSFRIPFAVGEKLIDAISGLRIGDIVERTREASEKGTVLTNTFPDLSWHFDFSPSLSTGQHGVMRQVSLISSGMRSRFREPLLPSSDNQNQNELRMPILLLIDEGDSFIHPQYQREYVNDLLPLLMDSASPGLVIQIIFTTHSPLILSDFPGYCFHRLLTKEDKAKMKAKGIDPLKTMPTFGANIQTLFKEDFFLDDTIGEFARNKINGVIRDIETKIKEEYQVTFAQVLPFEKLISLVGEKVVRNQLRAFLDMKLYASGNVEILEKLRKRRKERENEMLSTNGED